MGLHITDKIKSVILKQLTRKTNNKFNPEDFKRILVYRPAKIGDTICLIPLIRELHIAFPEVIIDVYASTYNNFMFKYINYVNNVYTKYRTKGTVKTLIDILRMRHNHYDLIIDTLDISFSKSITLIMINPSWLIGIGATNKRYGINNTDIKLYYKFANWEIKHISDQLLEFLPLLGIYKYNNSLEFPIGNEAKKYANNFLSGYKKQQLIGLNTDASDKNRSLTDNELISICKNIYNRNKNINILLFAAPNRRPHMKSIIANAILKNVILESGSSIFDAAGLVSLMDVIITPDTSFVHIASAYNIPTVGIYINNANHLKGWGPRSREHAVIQPVKQGNSIRGFSTDDVVKAVFDLLPKN